MARRRCEKRQQIKECKGVPVEKHHAEETCGLLEPGKAEEKDEVAAERAKNTPPSGKTQTLVY